MSSRVRTFFFSGFLVACVTLAGISVASADDPPANPKPPTAIEDYGYPGADRILTEKGITLKRGDGRILLADCDQAAQQIRVYTVEDTVTGREGLYCFRALGTTGWLTLELPRVFGIEAADRPVRASLTANGETTSVSVEQGGWTSVGEGTVGGARSVLVELRVTG
ncbi:hypothetical protein [Streptomyces acidiscabies]|uniref:Secreted protein n=1 Tax=Streptomyces acidiscabies TaxID=42234 RepID=A0AAP6BKQ1_9ACTN|nr:hypothetical protein [Streptomyces acidiscabies]MBP5938740.1 hypothetical protein [Streptomyces sp. LBUM 1476]MDX2966385.1 hypothetical protein [Streptomyces acidiscabies]MDX3020588.1 hypothetical protein [Streptomyces acidiscabies]MDX3796364.1 hypothetical protein [Streptomyces acidiscabies]